MIKFMRDKDGNLYSVKDGQVTGRIASFGDAETDKHPEEKKEKRQG